LIPAQVTRARSESESAKCALIVGGASDTKVAKDLGEDEDRLWDIEIESEDGVIWVYGG